MSRQRIGAKVRTNSDFKAMTAYLDSIGLRWRVAPPTGKGHPSLLIDIPGADEPMRYPIACTPKSSIPAAAKVGMLRKALRQAGVM